jgi:hypothetical protein
MTILRCFVFVAFGIVLLSGCEDTTSTTMPKSKKTAKSQPAADKADATPADKDEAAAETPPHGMSDPHGMFNPHGNMPPMGAAAKDDTPMENNGKLDLDTLHWTVPKTWVRKTPRSSFVQAEYALPVAEGDKATGRLTLSIAGGSVKDNIDRWRGQFSDKPKEAAETLDGGGVKVTLVDFSGTFHDSRGPMAPTVECPDYRMLGAIFGAGGQMHFVKAYGPSKTMAARAEEIRGFVRSLKVDK